MVNETVRRFGYPQTLVQEYEGWVVLLRNDQVTLGSLVLAVKDDATSLSGVSPDTLGELRSVTEDIERALAATFVPDKLNYLMLMMVDPHVHFHVLPRYAEPRDIAGVSFVDRAWPKPPVLSDVTRTTDAGREAIQNALRGAWPSPAGS